MHMHLENIVNGRRANTIAISSSNNLACRRLICRECGRTHRSRCDLTSFRGPAKRDKTEHLCFNAYFGLDATTACYPSSTHEPDCRLPSRGRKWRNRIGTSSRSSDHDILTPQLLPRQPSPRNLGEIPTSMKTAWQEIFHPSKQRLPAPSTLSIILTL